MHTRFDALDNGSIAASFLPSGLEHAIPQKLCEKLARTHYENFTVGSILLPKSLRRHVHNIYAYCRVCDDLADETGDTELSLRLLEWWRDELYDCFAGSPHHPVFQALRETVCAFGLPLEPFTDLIDAFIQDQHVTRYATFDDLLGYCKRSANPVGRLFLALLGYRDEARQALSDSTCTALQLANFWQDLASDYERGRIYIPQEDMERFGYTEAELRNHILNPCFVRLMRFEIARTRELLQHGERLPRMISGIGAADVALFTGGGRAILRAIERSRYDVFRRRVKVTSLGKCALLAGWCAKRLVP